MISGCSGSQVHRYGLKSCLYPTPWTWEALGYPPTSSSRDLGPRYQRELLPEPWPLSILLPTLFVPLCYLDTSLFLPPAKELFWDQVPLLFLCILKKNTQFYILHMIMSKTPKLSCVKLEQVSRDSGVSFEHKDTDYSCSQNTGLQGLSMLGRSHLGEDVSCKQESQIRRLEQEE